MNVCGGGLRGESPWSEEDFIDGNVRAEWFGRSRFEINRFLSPYLIRRLDPMCNLPSSGGLAQHSARLSVRNKKNLDISTALSLECHVFLLNYRDLQAISSPHPMC